MIICLLPSKFYYAFERGETTYATSHTGETRSTNTIKNVGLMYPSDYIYTGVDNTCFQSGYKCLSGQGGTPSSGWLFSSSIERTIIPSSSYSAGAFFAHSYGYVRSSSSYGGVDGSYVSRSCVYLRSGIEITDGDGSFEKPYKLPGT